MYVQVDLIRPTDTRAMSSCDADTFSANVFLSFIQAVYGLDFMSRLVERPEDSSTAWSVAPDVTVTAPGQSLCGFPAPSTPGVVYDGVARSGVSEPFEDDL